MARIRPYPDVFIGLKEATYKAEKFTMDEKRHYIPKMVKEYTGRNGDSGKGRNLYDRPSDVPEAIPWVDPNNKDSSNKKPRQKTIDPMFYFLLKWYIENRLRQESVTESRNVQPAVDLSIAPSGESSDNQSNVYSRLREYISASQSINNTSAMLPQNVYSHDHETENCDRVCKSLRKVTSALEDQGEDTQHVESIIKSLETYKIRKKENKRMWDCLRKIRVLTEKFEAYGIYRGFEQELRTLYGENAGEDQMSNIDVNDEISVMSNGNSGACGIERRTDKQPIPFPDKDPSFSQIFEWYEDEYYNSLKDMPWDSLLDLLDVNDDDVNKNIVPPEESDVSSRMPVGTRIDYNNTTSQPVGPESDVKIPPTSDSASKRTSNEQCSPIPDKYLKMDESYRDTEASHGMIHGEPPEQDPDSANIPNLDILRGQVDGERD